jgi:CRISPR-associated protein Csx17
MEPLGSYLKALAVLRLVAEQADSDARGWWAGNCFQLRSVFDEDGLSSFFLSRYRPTPILAPWNAGSGFCTEKGRAVVEVIAVSSDGRLADYRDAITRAIDIVKGVGGEKEDERRSEILRRCRNGLPDRAVEWLDAATAISANGTRTTAPILGTGGNEGNLEYGNHFMKYIALLLLGGAPTPTASSLLRNALFAESTGEFEPSSVGQFDPGRAGGRNQGQNMMTEKVPSNPWNFVLTLEGAVSWAAGLYRRQGFGYRSILCSPFTVDSSPVGYQSSTGKDRVATRAEIWAPVWEQPARYAEIKTLLREGRASLDGKPAQTGLEFAQAASSLGVDRGVTGFVRYSLLERRGKGYYVALPAGKFAVTYRRETDLVRELAPILERADILLRDAPVSYISLRRQVDEAVYQLLLRGGPEALRGVATSLGRVHRWILNTAKPIRLNASITPAWLTTLADFPEARIAAALAGISGSGAGVFRDHLDRNNRCFAWTGRDLSERLIRVLDKRIRDGSDQLHNPLRSSYSASASDVARFIEGALDDDLVEDLLFTFSLMRWGGQRIPAAPKDQAVAVWPVYAVLKHLFLPGSVPSAAGDVILRSDPRIIALLSSGDIRSATEIAVRRLQISGLKPIQAEYDGGIEPNRLAAALLIPVPYGPALRNAVLISTTTTRSRS